MTKPQQQRWLRPLPNRADTPDGVSYFAAPEAFRRKPHARVEATVRRRGPGYDWFIALRFIVGETTTAWFHVDDWWNDAEVALADAHHGAGILPHIRSGDVESTPDWTAWFRDRLVGATSPLYEGLWQLATFPHVEHRDLRHSCAPRPPRAVLPMPWPRAFETEAFDEIIPLRTASRPDSGRLRWYRKLAQQGKLPPVLLMYCAPLLGWLVIDGHDRMLAAGLEGIDPNYVGLTSVRRRAIPADPTRRAPAESALAASLRAKPNDQRAIESVNRALIALYEDNYFELRQRAWPLPGGAAAWLSEVAQLAAEGDAGQTLLDMVESVQRPTEGDFCTW